MDMPVYRHRRRILEALESHGAVVVESPTGSGKTTQIPRLLYEHGYGRTARIGITQPRRIAAVSVCRYLQQQMTAADGVPADLIAYKMRFEDTTTPSCAIKIMTDGILLQEMKLDADLREYQVVVVDEAHERSLNIDFTLGLLKQVLERRDDLRVVVSSATINAEAFSAYFSGCPIVRVASRTFPVDVHYRPIHPDNDPGGDPGGDRGDRHRDRPRLRAGRRPDLPERRTRDPRVHRNPAFLAARPAASAAAYVRQAERRRTAAGVR